MRIFLFFVGNIKALAEEVFQPFFTNKPTEHGTGPRLSLSYDIIKAHNGEIQFESIEGEGKILSTSLLLSFSNPS